MQGHSLEMVDLDLSFKSNPQPTVTEKHPQLITQKISLSELCKNIVPFVDTNNADHNTFIACLSLLSNESLYTDKGIDLLADILFRFNQALKNILCAPSNFSRKLDREWLLPLAEFNIILQPIKRRPRSLEAVPSYDRTRAPLTPRESLQSPTRKMDSPRVSSPVKEMLQMKRCWQDGNNPGLEKDQYDADTTLYHTLSLDQ